MDAMAEIRATFFEECDEQLCELRASLAAIGRGEADRETVAVAYRAVHSVKGGAASFQFNELSGFARLFEGVLNEVRSDRLAPTAAVVDTLLGSADVLADMIALARAAGLATDALKALMPPADDEPAEAGPESDGMDEIAFAPVAVELGDVFGSGENRFHIAFTPRADLYRNANESARLIREVLSLGTGTVACDTSATPRLDALDPEGAFLSWTIDLTTTHGEDALREIFDFAAFDCDLTITPEADAPGAGDFTFAGEAAEAMDPEMAALFARLQAA